MPIFRYATIFFLAAAIVACASSGRGGPGERRGPVGVNQPSALLAKARDIQAKQGCAKAAPTYRIVSSYGEGYEIAQYELGACLLEIEGGSVTETALFRDEGLFWLKRAAWAGNPRAQLKLAEILSGEPGSAVSHISADPARAMVWSIVYDQNGARETYGLKPVGPIVAGHLRAVLSAEMMDAARGDAARFQQISMDEFVPLAQDRDERAQSQERGRRSEGRRRQR
ncbi:hypothetical protein [Hyphococcus sp.]|uniref:hypothetical protein n=1 Tax=Hyphococcus sp. TaxID=2038636 RepID=UPI003CCB88DE